MTPRSATFAVYAQAAACEATEIIDKNREPKTGRRGVPRDRDTAHSVRPTGR